MFKIMMLCSRCAVLMTISLPIFGQASPINTKDVQIGYTRDYVTQDDLKGLAEFMDRMSLLEPKNLVSSSVARSRVIKMMDALKVACEITNVAEVASGTSTSAGKQESVGLYEVSCGNGMGYLLTLQGKTMVSGVSCLAAFGAANYRQVKAAPGVLCSLPQDADSGTIATAILRNKAMSCNVGGVTWLGQSTAKGRDYTEVTCADMAGYVLVTPLPGSDGEIKVLSCDEAAQQGVPCTMSKAATVVTSAEERPTLQWFKDTLAKNNVSCNSKQARIVGREKIKKRYIVEFQCDQQPQGLVVYVPTASDTTNIFESIDCAAAAKRNISCQFAVKAAGK